MKRLLIIRHAKSAHGPQYRSDFERPLNKRGQRDAAIMAKELKKSIDKLDCVLISAAERTKETASYFTDAYKLKREQLNFIKKLYLPAEEEIWEVIRSVDLDCENVAVFTHNPAAEDLLHRFRPGTSLPTCSIIEMHFDGEDWSDIDPAKVRFISHKYPRLYD